ncbi:unnamed protein product [Peniophora sp. CBMAI 1063]|nr:unnamed protein product [Peniophora sp. CBMAI 1063]
MDYTTQLPVETLCSIFAHAKRAMPAPGAQELVHFSEARYAYRVIALAWIPAVTHVCSRWRSVAVNDPSLWTDVPVVLGFEWLRTFVERSRMETITLDWKSLKHIEEGLLQHTLNRDWVMKEVLPRISGRTRNLIAIFDEHFTPRLSSCSWPMLEELSVVCHSSFEAANALLNQDIPCLRRLCWQCRSEDFPFDAPSLSSLTNLRLELPRGSYDTLMVPLIDLLSRITSLKHLQLYSVKRGFEAWGRQPGPCRTCLSPQRVQEIPSLKTLLLEATFREINHFITHIHPPAGVKLRLKENAYGRDGVSASSSMKTICHNLAAWYSASPDTTPFTTVELTNNSTMQLCVRLARCATYPTLLSQDAWDEHINGIHTDLEIECTVVGGLGLEMLVTILQVLGPQSVRALSLDVDHRLFRSIARCLSADVFHHVVALHFPQIDGVHCLETVSNNLFVPPGVTPFPSLRVISFPTANVRDALHWILNGAYEQSKDTLEEFLSRRRAADMSIRAVYLGLADEVRMIRQEGNPATTSCGQRSEDGWDAIRRAIDMLEAIPEVVFLSRGIDALYNEAAYNEVLQLERAVVKAT